MTQLKPLKKGDKIGIVSPSCWIDEERLNKGISCLESLGYQVYVHPQCYLRSQLHAGLEPQRVQAMYDLFEDPSVTAILCARGGHGSSRILELIDWQRISKHPKIFCGFSDITPLLVSLYQKAKIPVFHGPVLWGLGGDPSNFTIENFVKAVALEELEWSWDVQAGFGNDNRPYTLQPGSCEGKLIGGNLSLISLTMGTAFEIQTHDHILMIEDLDEKLYALDRYLRQLKMAGKLNHIKGLIVGEMHNIHDSNPSYGHSWHEMIKQACEGLEIPIVMNIPCGHTKDMLTLPIGGKVSLKATLEKIQINIKSF